MTVEKEYRTQFISCDGCNEVTEPYEYDEFHAMIAAAKADGWRIRRDDEGEWEHHCSSCKGNRVADTRRMFGL